MKHLALLAAIYALIVALVAPGSILAQEEAAPATETAAEPAPPEQAPAAAPAPAQASPAEPAPAAPTPAAPTPAEPAAAPPEPQVLADEREEAEAAEPKAIAAASGSVTIADFSFAPATITVSQGDTVTWTNDGPTPHSATASDGSFDTGIFPKGQSRSHTFNDAGTFAYICTPHPYMKGTVVVQASQTGSSDDSASSEGTGDSGTAGAEASQADDDGPSLPNTGSDAGALLLLGGLMLLLGVAVHRRTRPADPQPTGRIGW
jgi:LPXTG-motif cell wall-anchored protein